MAIKAEIWDLLDRLPQMVWANHDHGRRQYYNRRWQEFTGVDLGRNGSVRRLDLIHPDDRDRALALWDAAQHGDQYEAEYRLRHHSGEFRWIVSRGTPDRDAEGDIVAWYGTCTDIHDRKQALDSLQESEALNRSMIQFNGDSILLLDRDARIMFLNDAARAEVGDAATDRLGLNWLDAFPNKDEAKARQALADALGGGRGQLTICHQEEDGEVKWWEILVTPVLDADRRPISLVVSARDITAARLADERVQQLQNELIHVSRLSAMGTMAATLAHELNQPLTAIRNYMSGGQRLLEDMPGDTELLAKALEEGEKNAGRAGEIIRRLRNMAKGGSANRTIVDLGPVVVEAVDLALLGNPAGIELHKTIEPDLWAEVDTIQVQQVLMNLVRNALEAMEGQGTGRLSIWACARKEHILLQVGDSGPGFDDAARARLFEAFETSKQQGLGLGLSISRTIIEAHGGRIWASDNEPRGALFSILLPTAKPPQGG